MMPKPILIFTGTKNFGNQLEGKLKRDFPHSTVKFVSADNELSERKRWISAFMNMELDIMISTTILAWGVNLPARRVIIAHTSFGLQKMPICDVQQMIGRSGRPRYDKEGDAYILLDERDFDAERKAIDTGEDIFSTFGQLDVLQFHAIAEICNKNIKTAMDFYLWYSRSFAHLQGILPFSSEIVMEQLEKYRAIKQVDKMIEPRILGNISFWLYYPPRVTYQFDINIRIFSQYFGSKSVVQSEYFGESLNVSDLAVSMCFNWQISKQTFYSRDKKEEIEEFRDAVITACPEFYDNASNPHGTYMEAQYVQSVDR